MFSKSVCLNQLRLEENNFDLAEVEVDVFSVVWCDGRAESRPDDTVPGLAVPCVEVTPDVVCHVAKLVVASAASGSGHSDHLVLHGWTHQVIVVGDNSISWVVETLLDCRKSP